MFNYEQFPINRQFKPLSEDVSIEILLSHLTETQAVCVRTGSSSFLFTSADRELLTAGAGSTARQFLENRSYLASSLMTCSGGITSLKEFPDVADRPVLFESTQGEIIGYSLLSQLLGHVLAHEKRYSAYFSVLSETVNDAVTVVDQDGSVICWNSVAEQMYGISKNEIIGRRIGEHFDPQDLVVMSLLDEGRTIRNTYHKPRPNTHVLINASPIIDEEGNIIGGIASESDITHWVRLNDELTTVQADRPDPASKTADPFSMLSGKGKQINEAILFAKKAASTASTHLIISGEAGTGKEYWARIIHHAGLRREEPFLIMNCGAIPAGLLETELFGYQGGAYSGKDCEVAGKLEAAHNGTLYLEDIDLLPFDLQSKLYEYLDKQSIVRFGGSSRIPVNTRIIAATTKDLQELVTSNLFRADLFYKLSVMFISLPPLRDRKEDFHGMIHLFLKEFSLQYQKPMPNLSPEVMLAFVKYSWPGNIRELQTVLERCVILCEEDTITLSELPKHLQELQSQLEPKESESAILRSRVSKLPLSENEELRLIEEALATTLGNKSAAAKLLGMSRGTLYNKIKGNKTY